MCSAAHGRRPGAAHFAGAVSGARAWSMRVDKSLEARGLPQARTGSSVRTSPFRKDVSVTRIALFNHKGGVGKTTLTGNLADAPPRLGKRFFIVAPIPHSNLPHSFPPQPISLNLFLSPPHI